MDQLIHLAEREEERVKSTPVFQPIVQMYLDKLRHYRENFIQTYQCNIAEGFRKFQQQGSLELITCAATHGFLPLLGMHETAVRAQVVTALEMHQSFFGRPSPGFWFPECAYQPGQDRILGEIGIQYFFVETHGLLQASPRPPYGTYAPVACPSGVVAFGRDYESSKQVWSSKEGYPGDPDYREFYRDVGYDLTESQLEPYVQPEKIRRFTGLKYYRVTGSGDLKEPYDPPAARKKAELHAKDFLENRLKQMEKASQWMDRPPHLSCLYDAELFGHWWYEGPDFLYFLFETNQKARYPISFVFPSTYLAKYPESRPALPAFSSWGQGGYSEFWLNEANDWIYPHLNLACEELSELVEKVGKAQGVTERALNQAVRELFLAQASDWAFMIQTGHHKTYAEQRIKTHLNRFHQLVHQIRRRKIDEAFLTELEEKDNLFPQVHYQLFQNPEPQGS